MDQRLSRWLTTCSLLVLSGVLAVTACTHSNDRVVEPVGGGDASAPPPELGDSGVNPIGPVAHPADPPQEDFRLVRAPEFGLEREVQLVTLSPERQSGNSGSSAGGGAGFGGSDLRPVAAGGGYY